MLRNIFEFWDNGLLNKADNDIRHSISNRINKKEPWKISHIKTEGLRSDKPLKHQIKRRKLKKISSVSKRINRNK